jgi:diguanylate cyclase (GGDEF)-like protein
MLAFGNPKFVSAMFLLASIFAGQVFASQDSVRLQLKWHHQFQFAGYYAAVEKGYYRDAGLQVQLLEAQQGVDPTQQVLQGKAEFGVGNSDLIIDRANGAPVTVLAVIFQHSPLILIARQDSNIQSVHDLIGKTVMVESSSSELKAYLQREQIPYSDIRFQIHSQNTLDFIQGKSAAMSAYLTDELYEVREANIPFLVFSPNSAGIDFYGDNLFTTESQISLHPKRVRDFRSASLKGWEYATAHPAEMIELIRAKYSTQHDSAQLAFEAQSMQLLLASLLVPIGYMHEGRWQYMVDLYHEIGIIPSKIPLSGFLYTQNPAPPVHPSRPFSPISIIALLLAVGALAGLILMNRKLRQQIGERIQSEATTEQARQQSEISRQELINTLRELEMWATTDKLTALANRRQLEQRGEAEIARAHRYGTMLSILLLDLDHFKQVNDREGHHVGDNVLIDLAKVLRHQVRTTDIPGRWGGEEFLILLPGTSAEKAQVVAEKIRLAVFNHHYPCTSKVSASIGVTLLLPDETLDEVFRRADVALYEAKQNGRNRVVRK